MRKTVLFVFLLGSLLATTSFAQAPLQWPVRIDCTGFGQRCAPDYEFSVATVNALRIQLEAAQNFPSLASCSAADVELYINNQIVKPTQVLSATSSPTWEVRIGGGLDARFVVTGRQGGCNFGSLNRWGAILEVSNQPTQVDRCTHVGVPSGFVVIGRKTDSSCVTGFANVLRIPRNNEVICSNSPYPDGFVTVSETSESACLTGRAFRIQTPSLNNATTVCPGSPIPDAYVITSRPNETACHPTLPSSTIRLPDNDLEVCPGSNIPSGYVVVGRPDLIGCKTTIPGRRIRPVRVPKDTVCRDSPIPEGFEVTSTTRLSACGDQPDNAFVIEAPQGVAPSMSSDSTS
ncbi:MAG: hypothetical protein AAGD38_23770 [Acidobacteriota bacterium]